MKFSFLSERVLFKPKKSTFNKVLEIMKTAKKAISPNKEKSLKPAKEQSLPKKKQST